MSKLNEVVENARVNKDVLEAAIAATNELAEEALVLLKDGKLDSLEELLLDVLDNSEELVRASMEGTEVEAILNK